MSERTDHAPGASVPAQVDVGAAQAPQLRRDLPRCSDGARARCDPLGATAAWTWRWLLLEHPGPWAPTALDGAGLPDDVRAELVAAAADAGGRVLLVRRPAVRGGASAAEASPGTRRRWAVVDQPSGLTRWGGWDAADADGLLAAAAAMRAPMDPARADAGLLLLVCAHGRHDACCAVRGRPVAARLAARWPEQTWECSHLGGDRFAPNLLVLPDGAYYGGVDPSAAERVVEEHLAGAVRTQHLRGVSNGPPVAQAAVLGVLARFGPASVRDAVAGRAAPLGGGRWEVPVTGTGALPPRCVVTVAQTQRPPARLTCRAPGEAVAVVHEAVDVRLAPL
ncbi:sucrase ferredoxin [Pseudokineococcus sp. 1T1Z-3]|uniref:sucrase ferredoxin n=1 Tax=Pseudokineococcus sp. 1T1Z-3 TaxID=3132745 RepID=UPI00309C956C